VDVIIKSALGWPGRQARISVLFPAALLGRLTVIPYYPLSDEILKSIIRLQLGRIKQRLETNYEAAFTYDDAVVDLIAGRCTELESGGRMIDAILTQTLLPEISREFIRAFSEPFPRSIKLTRPQ
jgi:type VI secretion system protein VasG